MLHPSACDAPPTVPRLQALEPTLAPTIDPARLGMGLGGYIKDGWGGTAESAEQRLCMAMNLSVAEVDLYVCENAPLTQPDRPAP